MTFTPDIYEIIRKGCIDSARQVVPVLNEIFKLGSVVDVGGGEGWWGRQFAMLGVESVTVMDESILTPVLQGGDGGGVSYLPLNLEAESIAKYGLLGYDLALCLEVAEHVDAAHADSLVEQLCTVAPVVVFSAAVPGQGGHGHVNEQWPDYWYEKFAAHGFECYDFLRWRFWDNAAVEPWYRQNLLVYVNDDGGWVDRLSETGVSEWVHVFESNVDGPPTGVVHPIFFDNHPVEVGWKCDVCSTGWKEKPTVEGTVGCPCCGVKAC